VLDTLNLPNLQEETVLCLNYFRQWRSQAVLNHCEGNSLSVSVQNVSELDRYIGDYTTLLCGTPIGLIAVAAPMDLFDAVSDDILPGWRDEDAAILKPIWRVMLAFERVKQATPFSELPLVVESVNWEDDGIPLEAVLPLSVVHGERSFTVYVLVHGVKLEHLKQLLPEAPKQSVQDLSFEPSIRAAMPFGSHPLQDLKKVKPGDILLSASSTNAIDFELRLEDHPLFSVTCDSDGHITATQA